MNDDVPKAPVTVRIGGEEYTLRAAVAPEYTRRCAAYVDQTLDQIMAQSTLVEAHKAVILAALSLADQLFQVHDEAHELRSQLSRLAGELSGRIEQHLADAPSAPPA